MRLHFAAKLPVRTAGLLAALWLTACAAQPTQPAVPLPTAASSTGVGAPTEAVSAPAPADTAAPTNVGAPTETAAPAPSAAFDLPAPDCSQGPTPAQIEGPYYKADTPEEAVLDAGLPGTPITVTGYVLTADCRPVAGAWLDFWQADDAGAYDNAGYTLRGHQFTDAAGRYTLETVLPGLYPGRTRHIHVKVEAPNSASVLTTQLYFPEEAQRNQADNIYDARLLVTWLPAGAEKTAVFNFILAGQ